MMNKLLLFLLLLLLPTLGFSQSLERSLIGSAGNQKQTATIQLDWSIGETMVTDFDDSGISLSQGLNQWAKILTGVSEVPKWSNEISIAPNPFIDRLTLKSETIRIYSVELYDIAGNIVNKTKWNGNDKTLNLGYLSDGPYLILIKDPKGKLTAHKVIKQK